MLRPSLGRGIVVTLLPACSSPPGCASVSSIESIVFRHLGHVTPTASRHRWHCQAWGSQNKTKVPIEASVFVLFLVFLSCLGLNAVASPPISSKNLMCILYRKAFSRTVWALFVGEAITMAKIDTSLSVNRPTISLASVWSVSSIFQPFMSH